MGFQINYNDTITLLKAMERVKKPASFLLDTFFPKVEPISLTNQIMVEYREGRRRLAPFIIRGSRGVNMARDKTHAAVYSPPMIGARRVLNPEDLTQRTFGETIYSTMSEAQRAARIMARDLVELQDASVNRWNKMAADILLTGQCEIKGYADDGQTIKAETIVFEAWKQKLTPTTYWKQAGATIYTDIKNMCDEIRHNTGQIAKIMVCGSNIDQYLINNDEVSKWLMIPNRDNMALMTIAPRYVSDSIRRIGFISSLNLEVVCYDEYYEDDDGEIKPFIGADDVIIAIGGVGRQLPGAVTLINPKTLLPETYRAELVPYYTGDTKSQTSELAMYSRRLLCPMWSDEWATIKTCGE